MFGLPAWLANFLLGMAFKFGMPPVVAFLKEKFGFKVDHPVVQHFCEYVTEVKGGGDKRLARDRAKYKIRQYRNPRV